MSEQEYSVDDARKALEADKRSREQAALSEINEVLKRNRCKLVTFRYEEAGAPPVLDSRVVALD